MPKEICMLAHLYDPKRVIFPAYIQPKLDGVRAIWKHKERQFVSRNNKPLIVPQHIIDSILDSPFDLDGELIIPGKTFNEISGIVRHLDMIPEKRLLQYTVFDSFEQTTYDCRYGFLSLNYIHNTILTYLIYNFKELDDKHQRNLDSGHEGSIIRNNAPYEFKRSFNLLKLKPTKEIFCKIIGLIEGTGKYEGMLGALTVETSDKKVFNVGSGFTDFEREQFWVREPDDFKERPVIVKYQDLSEYGIPRFPVYKGFVR